MWKYACMEGFHIKSLLSFITMLALIDVILYDVTLNWFIKYKLKGIEILI